MTKYLFYTTEKCPVCPAMKIALKRLGVEFTEIKLKTGMIIPRDVRSVPMLAMENEGKRTTICTGWPGSIEKFEKILIKRDVSIRKNRGEKNERN